MEWSKLKNIILIMLAAVNLCLLFFVVQREWRDSANQRQNRQQAVDFLTDRGIQIHEGQLPDDQMVPRPQTVERDQEEESRLATQLLGEDVVVQARGAGVYRYQNGAGALQFHSDGSFSAELSPDSFPLGVDPVSYTHLGEPLPVGGGAHLLSWRLFRFSGGYPTPSAGGLAVR